MRLKLGFPFGRKIDRYRHGRSTSFVAIGPIVGRFSPAVRGLAACARPTGFRLWELIPLRRLLLLTIADIALVALLFILVGFLLANIVAFAGAEPIRYTERWRFSSLPVDDAPLVAWASKQPGLQRLQAQRINPRELEVAYERQGLGARVEFPWQRLGYQGAQRRTPNADEEATDNPRLALVSLFSLQMALLAGGLWMRVRQENPPPLWNGPLVRAVALGVPYGAALMVAAGLYSLLVTRLFGSGVLPPPLPFDLSRFAPWQAVLVVVSGAVVAPLVEEFFFRGALFGQYLEQGRERLGLVLSAVLFSVLHLKPVLIPAFVAMGFILALAYRRTGSLATPIVAHALNNGFAFVVLLGTSK